MLARLSDRVRGGSRATRNPIQTCTRNNLYVHQVLVSGMTRVVRVSASPKNENVPDCSRYSIGRGEEDMSRERIQAAKRINVDGVFPKIFRN